MKRSHEGKLDFCCMKKLLELSKPRPGLGLTVQRWKLGKDIELGIAES